MNPEMTRIIRISILGAISLLPLLILPVMVGALVDDVGFTESEAGWVTAIFFVGSAIAALVIGLRIRHLDPLKLATFGLLMLVVFDATAILVSQLPVWLFLVTRFLAGVGSACAYAAVMASIASTSVPERGYGIFMAIQFLVSALGFYGLPWLLLYVGVEGLYFTLAAAAGLALLLRSSVVHRESVVHDAAIELHTLLKPAAILVLLGIGVFEIANMLWYTYSERIGVSVGLSDYRVGEILGFASLLGIPAALGVAWLGDRLGQLMPLLFLASVGIVFSAWLLGDPGQLTYRTSIYLLNCVWAAGLPYFQALAARLDPGGSIVVVCGFFTANADFIGPAMAAVFVDYGGYGLVLTGAMGFYAVTAVLVSLSVRFAKGS